jgi:hypothetical protein
MEKRFGALRFVGTIYKVLGIFIGILTFISAIGICVMSTLSGSILTLILNNVSNNYGGGNSTGPVGLLGGILGGVIVGGIILINGGIIAITSFAAGEGIYLAIGIEENTRTTAFLLQQRN